MPRTRTKPYPGSLTKRGDTWRLRLCVGGKYHSFTLQGTKVEAGNFATEKYKELAGDLGRAKAGKPGPIRFSALLEEFTTYGLPLLSPGGQRSYRNSFAPFRAFFVEQLGDPLVRDVSRGQIKTYMEWRLCARIGGKGGVSKHTVARDRRVLHVLFNYAIDREYLEANPCHAVRAPKGDRRNYVILNTEQMEALLTASAHNPMLHLYVLLLAETGARADTEAPKIRWEDVDLAKGFLHLKSAPTRRNKNGLSRYAPITARLKTALQEHAANYRLATYAADRSPYVFHHLTSGRGAVAGEPIRQIVGPFKAAVKAAKLPAGFRRHDLRHRRVTTWLAEGKSPALVMKAMGHADLATTMGYMHLVPDDLRALVEETQAASRVKAAGGGQ
jgi:integrase